MALTDTAIRNAKALDKAYKLYDEKGFFMQVTSSGHQLAHKVPDALGSAYNCTKFSEQRKTMMQQWADYLDELKAGAKVIPLHGKSA